MKHNATQCNPAQRNATQHNSTQHNTTQLNTKVTEEEILHMWIYCVTIQFINVNTIILFNLDEL